MKDFINLIKKSKCAPHLKSSSDKCFTLKQLKKIGKELNKYLKKNKQKLINLKQSKLKLWNDIEEYFKSRCNSDGQCWLKQKEIKSIVDENMNLFTFLPKMPEEWKKDKYTWLNSLDILYLMVLAEKVFPKFKFFGPVPSDCPEGVNCELSKLNITNLLKKNKNKLGIIYNLDVSTGPGTHWTAVFIDSNKNHINYYDSYGDKPILLIQKFMERIHNQMINNKQNKKKPVVIYNDKQHQKGHSECGMFSMNFILQRLNGLSMYDISQKNFTDDQMNDLRNVFYR